MQWLKVLYRQRKKNRVRQKADTKRTGAQENMTQEKTQAENNVLTGSFLSNVAISKIGVNKAAPFIGASTVVSILSGTLLLRENFTVYQMAGAAVILAGVYLAN